MFTVSAELYASFMLLQRFAKQFAGLAGIHRPIVCLSDDLHVLLQLFGIELPLERPSVR